MKFWVYLHGEIPGSYEPEELSAMPDFAETSMVCPAEGGAEDRNWRRAGQFPEILEILHRRRNAPLAPAPRPPIVAAEPAQAMSPDDILADSSSRIFRHVSELMKELENRREERALTQSLQRQLVELKNELLALRERNLFLQDRSELIPGFEERQRKLEEQLLRLRAEQQETERRSTEMQHRIETLREEGERLRRAEASLSEELKRQTALGEEHIQQLARKEYSLAKAFGIIRKLEKMLGEILPASVAGIARELPGYGPAPREPQDAPTTAIAVPAPSPAPASAQPSVETALPAPSQEPAGTAALPGMAPPQAPPASGLDLAPPPEGDPSDAMTPIPTPLQQKVATLGDFLRRKLFGK